METHKRGSDGRRLFRPGFKREQIERVLSGELTMAELSREFSVGPTVIRRSNSALPQQRIRELERLVGKKAMEIEILQAAREEVKKSRAGTAHPRDDGS